MVHRPESESASYAALWRRYERKDNLAVANA
jgi:hypothetical protein